MKIIEVIKKNIEDYKKIQVPDIGNDSDYSAASDSVKFLNDKFKYVETKRKELLAPLVAENKNINSKFKTVSDPLKKLMGEIKTEMLSYMNKKEKEQLAYEEKMKEEHKDADVLVIDDKVRNIKQSEFSSNTKKTVTKYRVKDETLIDIISIKQLKLKEWILKGNKLPDWVESYEEESIVVRTK